MLIQTVIVMRHARIVRWKTNNELTVEIERIKGDIKLIHKSIETIEKNHLRHIEDDVNSIKKVLWTVAVVAGTQMIIVIRELLIRGIA